MKIRCAIIVLLCACCLSLFSNSKPLIDSLNKIKYDNPHGCIKRCHEIIASGKVKDPFVFYSFIADSYWHLGNQDSALVYYNYCMKSAKIKNSPIYIGMSLSNIGYILVEKTRYKEALDNFFKAIDIFKSINDSVQIRVTQTYIVNVYYYMGNYEDGLKISIPLAKYYESVRDYYNACISYEMLGHIYREIPDIKKAEANYLIALKFAEQSKNVKRLAEVKFNYADFLMDLKMYEKGEVIILQAVEDLKKVSAFNDIAVAYMQLGDHYFKVREYAKSKTYIFKALEIAGQSDRNYVLFECYESLAEIYEAEQNWEEALFYHKKFKSLTDSVAKATTGKELLDLATKYETEKKDKENELLQTKNQLSEKSIKAQKTVTYFIVVGLVLVSFLAFFIFRGLKQQRRANKIISLQKHEVEEHRKDILDSIHYAKRIQNTLLAHHEFLNENIPSNFVLFKPKDIVSGDFYWATKHGSRFYLAVCDSTGHGVPGAFMSLLNINFLNEAINEKNILEPDKIFNYVRERLITSISKEGQQDGFDGILLCMDSSAEGITYVAANNAPILVSGNSYAELEKDKMPVGKGEATRDFKLQRVNVNKGDTLYLYTDGYADQFGGPKGKKFKYRQLNELLLATSLRCMDEQAGILNETLENWKGNLEQVDDVCLIGIKF
jgi:serine phosphatase RsbU (regulator of sigma subunit)/Tfp pilus assembly protein PilF